MCVLLAPAAPAQQPQPVSGPAQRTAITVVMDDQYPPYIFRDHEGRLHGILKDTWELWSGKTGIAVKLEAMDWAKAQQFMRDGKADVIDTIFKTEARLKLYDYSKPRATLEVPIFFHKSISGISDAESLQGFTVGVKDGDACIDYLTEHGITSFKKYPSYEAIINSAAGNLVKVFCIDKPPALYLLSKKELESEFRYSEPLYTGQFHWATRKGDAALHELIARGYERISERELANIDQKWMGSPISRVLDRDLVRYAVYMLSLALIAIVSILLWNWMLRRRVAARTAELRNTLDDLRASQRHFEALVSTTPVGVFEADASGAWTYVNARWLAISGLSLQETLGLKWAQALHPDSREVILREWQDSVRQGRPSTVEFRLGDDGRQERWVLGQATPLWDGAGKVTGFIGSMTDITERKAAEAQVEYLAYHDPLTGLPNRLLFKDHMQLAMAYAEREDVKVALLFLDLDKFKTVNDSLGHPVGDALLKVVAQRLQACVRSTDTVSRLGGDEFLVLLSSVGDVLTITAVLDKILAQLAAGFDIDGQDMVTTASIGIAVFPDDGRDFDTLLKKADIAMYSAKEAGRNAYRFYTERMNLNALQTLQMRNRLRHALERKEFVLHYQPQFDIASRAVVGVEALIRWRHPELGLVMPGEFIPVAEDSGFIVEIGDWVLREACRQGQQWRAAGMAGLVVAVNLSAVQFKRGELERSVAAALAESEFDPALLELELTESILIQDTENVLETVRQLKALGVKLSIDDFGTGYSSLAYLKRFNLDKLKIDQSFVRSMISNAEDSAIVRAIIQLGQSLGLKLIAEGVEDEQQMAFLSQHHCDQVQGYLLGAPMAAEKVAAFLAERAMLSM